MKKTAWLLLLLLLAIGCIACSGEPNKDADTSSDSIADTTAEVSAERISFEDLQQYRIICPERYDDEAMGKEIAALANELRQFVPDMILRDDYIQENNPSSTDRIEPYEILIGATNRPESQSFLASLERTRDYGYAVVNGKIVIAGATTETTRFAIALFRENVISAADENESFYTAEDDRIVTDTYALDVFEIGGIPIAEYTVVYPAENACGEEYCAQWLAAQIDTLAGKRLSVVTDAAPEAAHEIRIGRTARDEAATMPTTETYGITVGDGHVQISAEAPYVLLAACGTLTAGDDVPADGKELRIPDGTEILTAVDTTELQAMSFNVFYDLEQREGDRAARVCTVIEQFLPDTFGVQEATGEWMRILRETFGDLYESVGISRGGTPHPKEEHSAIFYKKGMFREIESGTKWLSPTPDVYSKVEESGLPRIFTYALLERCADGRQILYVNTHLDLTNAARVKQVSYLLDFLSAYEDIPVVLTGDFNAESDHDPIRMIEDTSLVDSSRIAEQAYTRTTWTDFGELEGDDGESIDYVFVSEDRIDVADYRVFDEMVDGDYPSDHFPVVIRYRLKDTQA